MVRVNAFSCREVHHIRLSEKAPFQKGVIVQNPIMAPTYSAEKIIGTNYEWRKELTNE